MKPRVQPNDQTVTSTKGSSNRRGQPLARSTDRFNAPDLTQRPPRSPRSRLGGYALLPRMLDKGRATLAGKHGEYHFNCPLDQRFLSFAGIDPKKLLTELKKGKGDGEILDWIQAGSKHKRQQ